jgi:hypothetical protein
MEKRITRSKTLGVLTLLLAGSASSALADQINVPMTFNGVLDGATWTGPGETVYVSPYTSTDTATSTPITIYCLDYNHEIDPPATWTADFLSLNMANITTLYYGPSTSAPTVTDSSGQDSLSTSTGLNTTVMLERYLEAAYLFQQILNLKLNVSTNDTSAHEKLQSELNVAAWTLFLDASPAAGGATYTTTSLADFEKCINEDLCNASNPDTAFANAVYDDLQDAQTAVLGGYAAPGWYAVTPYNKTPGSGDVTQEFLAYDLTETSNQDPVVPEPQAILLFGTLVGILGASRYRRQKRA